MPEWTKPLPGVFCWVEQASSNTAASRKFYGSLFDWKMDEIPMPGGGVYGLAKIGDKLVGGIGTLDETAKKMGAGPQWLSYVAVEDAAATAKKAESLGGKLLLGPMKTDQGTMAILADPAEGTFALWQPHQSMGTFLYQEPRALSWNELATKDVDRAGKFYSSLFGWKAEPTEMSGTTYTLFKKGEGSVGGMMGVSGGKDGPPIGWTVYFAVASADDTVKKVTSLGGKSLGPARDIPNVGRFAFFRDPEGAFFAVLQAIPPQK